MNLWEQEAIRALHGAISDLFFDLDKREVYEDDTRYYRLRSRAEVYIYLSSRYDEQWYYYVPYDDDGEMQYYPGVKDIKDAMDDLEPLFKVVFDGGELWN